MADNTTISTVYNHFLTTYAPTGTNSKYDTHKKSELRGLYNSIVKMNKEAPLFLLIFVLMGTMNKHRQNTPETVVIFQNSPYNRAVFVLL